MDSLFLQHDEFIYIRLLALTWRNNFLTPLVCTSSAGRCLLDQIKNSDTKLPLILNCSGVTAIEDHAFSDLEKFLAESENVVAFWIGDGSEQLIREVESELKAVKICSESVDGGQIYVYGNRDKARVLRNRLETMVKEAAGLERAFVTKSVVACYKDFSTPERLDSTPLLASGVLNARELISDPTKFVWTSLLLTELFERVIDESRPRTNRLLAVSLRGSPFAAAVRLLSRSCTPSLEIIDHIGPSHDLLEASVGQPDMYGGEYVLVADFVIGGTELKIARTYALSQGANIKNAISIGSFLSRDAYDRNITLHSLANISEVVPQLTYEFKAPETNQ